MCALGQFSLPVFSSQVSLANTNLFNVCSSSSISSSKRMDGVNMRNIVSLINAGRQSSVKYIGQKTSHHLPYMASQQEQTWSYRRVIAMRFFGDLPHHTKLGMPALSPTMSQGNLVEWKVKEGQTVAAGDILADVETDKATLGWENQDDGVIAKLLIPNGTQGVDVGQIVAIVVDDEADVDAFKEYAIEGQSSSNSGGQETVAESHGGATGSSNGHHKMQDANARIGPAARILMESHGIEPTLVVPSGPRGIITKGDVLAALQKSGVTSASELGRSTEVKPAPSQDGTSSPAAPQPARTNTSSSGTNEEVDYVDIPTSNIRKIIARRLLESKTTVPHMYVSENVMLDRIVDMRAALKSRGVKVSVNDCVIRAIALALEEVPAANASWDDHAGKPVHFGSVDVSVAVATENGLFTPIVKNANVKSLTEISADVKSLAKKARENKLLPEEFQGGSFSVSNLGMFGVDSFSAIINPPQGGILAVGGSRNVARWESEAATPTAVSEMTVTLSADSRVFDGQTAADFLAAFKANMENPFRLASV